MHPTKHFPILFVALLVCVHAGAGEAHGPRLETGGHCMACHSGMTTPSGEDISIGSSWRASMMGNSARDPYWQAAVRREVMDHPTSSAAIEDSCATCHMPMARVHAAMRGAQASVFDNLAAAPADPATSELARDGVSCGLCHQIRGDNFGASSSFSGGFRIEAPPSASAAPVFGPFEVDRGRQRVMQSATDFVPTSSSHVQQSEFCATCHTLYTHALNSAGEEIGRLPEQVPYLEWQHSEYRNARSCQDCHMPAVAGDAPITSVLGQPRSGVSRHTFEGANAYMLRMLNKYRGELGVTASSQELESAAGRTIEFLRTQSAQLAVEATQVYADRLSFDVVVRNLAGHKFPTAYPSRRAWLHVVARNAAGAILFESGALQPDGSITGNANDSDPARFEPHYARIERADEVQIYESVMTDTAGRVTTGLLSAVRYVKDNRLLPQGFEKASAGEDIAVRGEALTDVDFQAGGDRVRYFLPIAQGLAAVTVTAELWFQPIGYRWAYNLRQYDTPETRRFVRYFEETSTASAVLVASATASVRPVQ